MHKICTATSSLNEVTPGEYERYEKGGAQDVHDNSPPRRRGPIVIDDEVGFGPDFIWYHPLPRPSAMMLRLGIFILFS